MRDYKKHLTLLPHKYQATALFAAVVLAVVHYVGLIQIIRTLTVDTNLAGMYWWGMISTLATIALTIACLSKEKVEDEYITSVRYRALTITIFVSFIIRVISEMMYGSLHSIVFSELFVGPAFTEKLLGAAAFRRILNIVRFLGSTHVLMFLYIILLKVLIHKGSGNSYKSILLPYSYKRIGWYIFIGSLVFIPLFIWLVCHFWMAHNNPGNGYLSVRDAYEAHVTLFRLLIVIPYIGLMFICLSKEKQEDEFIRYIRARILVFFTIFVLIIGIINAFANSGLEVYLSNTHNYKAYVPMFTVLFLRLLLWFPLVSVVYALVLRKVLSNNLKESNDEK